MNLIKWVLSLACFLPREGVGPSAVGVQQGDPLGPLLYSPSCTILRWLSAITLLRMCGAGSRLVHVARALLADCTPDKDVMCNGLLTPANIPDQTETIRAKGTRGLNCNWDKMVRPGQQGVLLPFSGFSSCGYSSSFSRCIQYV